MKYLSEYNLFEGRVALKAFNIFYFIKRGDLLSVDRIVKKEPEVLKLLDKYENTPLGFAVNCAQFDIAEFLLEQGADPNTRVMSNRKVPILFSATHQGNFDFVKKLVDYGADINLVDDHGENILFYSSCIWTMGGVNSFGGDNYEMTKFFLDKKVNPNHVADLRGNKRTPVMVCINLRKYDILELLLQYGADPNYKDEKTGEPILFYTVKHGDAESIDLLIKHGADIAYKWRLEGSDTYIDIIDQCHTNNTKAWLSRYETQKLLAEKDPNMLLAIETNFKYQHVNDRPKIDPRIKKEYPEIFIAHDLNLL